MKTTKIMKKKKKKNKLRALHALAVSHGKRTRRLIVPGSGQAALFTRRAIAPEGKQSRHTKNRVQSLR
jgi:hypothetical protein